MEDADVAAAENAEREVSGGEEEDLALIAIQQITRTTQPSWLRLFMSTFCEAPGRQVLQKPVLMLGVLNHDAGRSNNIDLFAGKPAEPGETARYRLSSFEVNLDSVDNTRPVPKIATYLTGDAQEWWKPQGKAAVGLDATFEQFVAAFLARFVKAADGQKARAELSERKQHESTVEAFAAQFRSCAACIDASSTGTPVDSTTQAG